MRRWGKRLVTALAVVVVLLVVAVGVLWWVSRPADPGAFYEPPADVPAEPGRIVRSEGFDTGVPDGAEAHLFLYTTTQYDGSAAVASATVLVPTAPAEEPRPVLAWAHGTTGIVPGCAPSLLDDPFGGIPALRQVLDAGWVVVATDYVGLGTPGPHQYLVGDSAARNTLDSVRALRQLEADEDLTGGVGLAEEVQVWGHSQGGNTSLFTGEVADAYAPDVDVVGVAAFAPATELSRLLAAEADSLVGKVLSSLAMVSWGEVYPEVSFDEVVRTPAQPLVRSIADRCITKPAAFLSAAEGVAIQGSIFAVDVETDATLQGLLERNTPHEPIPAPLFVAQGTSDEVVDPDVTDDWVESRCDAGQAMTYRTYADQSHLSIVAPDSPVTDELVRWATDRFAGDAAPTDCDIAEGAAGG